MIRLEELPLSIRLLIGAITVAITMLVLLVLERLFAEEVPLPPLPPLSKYEDRILQLEEEAIDEAFKAHIKRLFDIWVTDYQKSQPPRALHGARNAREAYVGSMTAIEQRKERLRGSR